jgi:hypothetical protein
LAVKSPPEASRRYPFTSSDLAVLIDVLEQLLAGQLLAAADERGEATIAQADLVGGSGLAAEAETDARALDSGVSVTQRGQPERAVEPRVLVVTDPDERELEQADDRGEDLLAGQPRSGEVGIAAAPDARERSREGEHAVELLRAAPLVPVRVVAVLLAAAVIATGRLQVPVRPRADPDVGPGRRDRECRDAAALLGIADRPAVDIAVREATAGAMPGDPGPRVGRVAEPGCAGDIAGGGGSGGVDHARTIGEREHEGNRSRGFATRLQPVGPTMRI